MKRRVMLDRIDIACEKFLEEQGRKAYACKYCPIYKNGLCDRIFNDESFTDEELMEAYNIMCAGMPVISKEGNAWDIIRGMTEEEYEDFKEFLYDKYASMCGINDLISEFSNDELIEKYKEFKRF